MRLTIKHKVEASYGQKVGGIGILHAQKVTWIWRESRNYQRSYNHDNVSKQLQGVRGASPNAHRHAGGGGEAQAADELSQLIRSFIMAALPETAEPVTAKGMGDVIAPNHVTASTRPAVAEGKQHAHPHADSVSILERLVI
jgi:hypothetical protein